MEKKQYSNHQIIKSMYRKINYYILKNENINYCNDQIKNWKNKIFRDFFEII